jgi:hypothetical protein
VCLRRAVVCEGTWCFVAGCSGVAAEAGAASQATHVSTSASAKNVEAGLIVTVCSGQWDIEWEAESRRENRALID